MSKILLSEFFHEDDCPKKCTHCGSSKFKTKVLGVVDVYQGMGPVCEKDLICECGECVGFWAYGYWDPCFADEFKRIHKL